MEHPPPLPTQTSLEDLPPPYLDYLDAAALCRLGYGTTKKQHYGVTSAVVRCATERDAVPLGATAPPHVAYSTSTSAALATSALHMFDCEQR